MNYKSEILEMIHENAIANFEIGAISEERMREYDDICLAEDSETALKSINSSEKKQSILATV